MSEISTLKLSQSVNLKKMSQNQLKANVDAHEAVNVDKLKNASYTSSDMGSGVTK